jgi:group II intron reverse transcriptase/maturase
MKGTSNPQPISTKLERIAELARKMPGAELRTLAHHIDIEWLREAYRRTRKDGAAGVDGRTAREYEENLEGNLRSLLDRAKSGSYKAPPVRRVYIPKADGRERPIGIPTLEDKILQRAVLMVLEAVYEQDFLDCSYGFRPGRSAHDALLYLRDQTMDMHGGWILETDIESFFDSVDRDVLRQILTKRVRDGVLVRLIGKWMKAGVMEDGCVYHPETGTPQGGVISPLLANIVLHEVVDVWFEEQVKPRLRGRAHLVRFADDLVIVFAREDDARRVLDVLPKRLERYKLRMHPEKTRLVRFERPPYRSEPKRDERPETFDFLGFTHYWAKSRLGNWVVKRKTQSSRVTRTLKRFARWCQHNRHEPVKWQHQVLSAKLRGHDAYYGVIANYRALKSLRYQVERLWRKWLSRRSWAARINWMSMARILGRYPLPGPRIHHPRERRVAKP